MEVKPRSNTHINLHNKTNQKQNKCPSPNLRLLKRQGSVLSHTFFFFLSFSLPQLSGTCAPDSRVPSEDSAVCSVSSAAEISGVSPASFTVSDLIHQVCHSQQKEGEKRRPQLPNLFQGLLYSFFPQEEQQQKQTNPTPPSANPQEFSFSRVLTH